MSQLLDDLSWVTFADEPGEPCDGRPEYEGGHRCPDVARWKIAWDALCGGSPHLLCDQHVALLREIDRECAGKWACPYCARTMRLLRIFPLR